MLVLGLASSSTNAASPVELQNALDGAVAAGVPGAIVLVRDGDRTIRLTSGYGNLATKTPIRTTQRFRVGSLTKTFVSTVALQLVGEGKLSLDDTVEQWLPGLVPNGGEISIRQLLNMTAGLYDYLNEDQTINDRMRGGNLTYRYKPRELVRIATAHKPNFAPGTKWSYCNTCYVLIGLVVEKVTGRTIGAELSRRIFVPLHLRHTSFDTEPRIAGAHSHGYYRIGQRLLDVSVASPSSAWAAGGMTSTADDLERFFTALGRGRLLTPELSRAMRTHVPSSGYALGIGRVVSPCGTFWGNNGNFLGYNASAWGTPGGKWQLIAFVSLDESALTPQITNALNRVLITALCGGRSR
jgi:D-alanyl-D-alanine carboxypeptidase